MQLRETFERLGLPKHSAEIFEVLEKSGPSNVSAISKALRVHRPAIYRALNALSKIHFVSEKQFGKRPLYAAEERSRITHAFALGAKDVSTLERAAERSPSLGMGSIRYLEGEKGVGAIFNDIVEHCRRGDTFYRYTSERDLDAVNRLLSSDYRKRRDAKRLERLVISNPESGKRKRNRLERFIKFLGSEKESFHQNAIQLVYGKRIAFLDLNTYKGFIIENETLAEFQKTIFRALYKRL